MHLWLGLGSGLIVVIVGITGAIYAFEKEIREVLHADCYVAKPVNGNNLSIDSIINSAKKVIPKQAVKQVIIFPEGRTIQVNFKNRWSVFVHPKTGEICGKYNQEKEVLGIVLKLHRQLYLGDVGKKITGISCLIFFFSLLTGLLLWWPKRWQHLKQRLGIAIAHGKKRLNYDLHRSLGFYASFILLVVALSGLVFSFKWVEKMLFTLSGSAQKPPKYFSDTSFKKRQIRYEELLSDIRRKQTTQTLLVVLPEEPAGSIRITVQQDRRGLLTVNDHYFYDRYTGKLLAERLFSTQSMGEKLRASNYNFHTGKVFGVLGEVLVCIAGLIAASLPITGFIIWNNRRKKARLS